MLRTLSLTMFLVFSSQVVFSSHVGAQEVPKDRRDLSPREVVKRWTDAAGKRDMKALADLASKDTRKTTFELIGQQTFPLYQGETKIIHEEISGDRAIVIYRIENRGAVFTPEIRYDMTNLAREEGRWKVAPDGGGVLKEGKQPKR